MRELLRAVFLKKPLVVLLESDPKHGRLTLDELREGLQDAQDKYAEWGLLDEMVEWGVGFLVPPSARLFKLLQAAKPLEWTRAAAFQDVTLRLIAERLLPPEMKGTTYVQHELMRQKIKLALPSTAWHIYCSPHNAGALELMQDVAADHGLLMVMRDVGEVSRRHARRRSSGEAEGKLYATNIMSHMTSCSHMLVYLNQRTWNNGGASGAFANEVS